MADEQAPDVGESRTANGETRTWDGSAWRLSKPAAGGPQSFLGNEDFLGRMQRYGVPVLKTMASDIAAPVLHPINTVTGLASAVAHPLTTAENLYQTGKSAVQGDPESMGHLLAMAAAPKVADKSLSGVNSLAHAVAENPAVRSGIGYVGGAGTALATGAGHPFIGAAVGRIASPLMKGPASELAGATDWIKQKLGVGSPISTVEKTGGLSAEQQALYDLLQKQNATPRAPMPYGKPAPTGQSFVKPEQIANQPQSGTPSLVGVTSASATAPKPFISAADIPMIRHFMDNGMPAKDAADLVSKLKASPALGGRLAIDAPSVKSQVTGVSPIQQP